MVTADEDAVILASALKTLLTREVVPETVGATLEVQHRSARPPACEHHQLEFDQLGDLYCKHCGKDFTD